MTKEQLGECLQDPCYAVVFEAVKALSRRERRTDDFKLWLWYCRRIGYNTLLDQLFRLEHEMETDRLEGRAPVRNPAAVYHARLKSIYAFQQQKQHERKPTHA
jgi:hypothetical protein